MLFKTLLYALHPENYSWIQASEVIRIRESMKRRLISYFLSDYAACERSWSLQNIIRTDLRNRLKEKSINKLMTTEWTLRKITKDETIECYDYAEDSINIKE